VDIVTPAHLVFEEARQQQALGPRGFQHKGIAERARIRNEVVEYGTQVCRHR